MHLTIRRQTIVFTGIFPYVANIKRLKTLFCDLKNFLEPKNLKYLINFLCKIITNSAEHHQKKMDHSKA